MWRDSREKKSKHERASKQEITQAVIYDGRIKGDSWLAGGCDSNINPKNCLFVWLHKWSEFARLVLETGGPIISVYLFITHTANMDTCWCPAQEQGNLFRILLQIRPRHNQKSEDWNTSVPTSKSTKSNCVKHVKRHVCCFIVLDVISCQKTPADWETSGIYSWGPWWPLRPAHLEVEFQSTPR